MRWVAAVAIAAGGLLLVLAAWERAPERNTRAADSETARAPAAAPTGTVGASSDDSEPNNDTVRDPGNEPRPEPPWRDGRGTPRSNEADAPLSGTLRVEGEAGAPSGSFRLGWETPRGYDEDDVGVCNGAWSATVPRDATLEFRDIRLGGRCAVAVDRSVAVPESGRVVIRCRWFVPTALRVVDAETGSELAGVEVARCAAGNWQHDDEIHPGPESAGRARVVASNADSPVTLPSEPGTQTYWVRAPEHAWMRIVLEQSFGGERVVRLPRAGSLHVLLSNFDPASKAEVRLYTAPGRSHLLSWPSGPARIDSLAPGQYCVRVEVGDWFRRPRCLGQARVEVEAGAVREVTIDVERQPGPPLVPLAGTLHVDPAWDDSEWIYLSASGVNVPPGTADPDVELDRDGRWSAGRVPPGRYKIVAHPWTWCVVVDVGPKGNTSARIVIPPPCDLEVRVLEADSDETAPVEELDWHMQRPGGGLLQTETAEAAGRFRFQAPVGKVVLRAAGDRFDTGDKVVDLKPGLNRITLRAKRQYGIAITLEDGATGTRVPIDDHFCGRIFVSGAEDPECRSTVGYSQGVGCIVGVTKPGRYQVVFMAEIDGYKSIDDTEVVVPAEGTARLVVRLERKN